MSDYLSNLAARAIGEGEAAIRPRLRSRFEPAPRALAPPLMPEPAEDLLETTPAEPAATVAPPVPVTPPRQVPTRGIARAAQEEPPPRPQPEPPAHETPAAGHTPAPQRPAEQQPEPSPASMARRPVGAVVRPTIRAHADVAQSSPAPESAQAAARPAATSPMPPAPLRDEATPPQTVSRVTEPGTSSPEHGEHEEYGDAPMPPRANVPTHHRANVLTPRRADAPSPQRVNLPDAEQTEPTVHVTIGRIEVRVAPPPPTAERPKPPSPRLGLDEYLRRQAGGGR